MTFVLHPPPALVELGVGQVGSDQGAVASLSAGTSPWPAPRTGRAASTASGSPQVPLGYATSTVVIPLHGEGIAAPR